MDIQVSYEVSTDNTEPHSSGLAKGKLTESFQTWLLLVNMAEIWIFPQQTFAKHKQYWKDRKQRKQVPRSYALENLCFKLTYLLGIQNVPILSFFFIFFFSQIDLSWLGRVAWHTFCALAWLMQKTSLSLLGLLRLQLTQSSGTGMPTKWNQDILFIVRDDLKITNLVCTCVQDVALTWEPSCQVLLPSCFHVSQKCRGCPHH